MKRERKGEKWMSSKGVSRCDAKNGILLATQGDEKFVEGVG